MSAIADAAAALARVRSLNAPARQIVLSIGYFESGFGTIPMLHGFVYADGTPTHNWGALVGSGDAGSMPHEDSDQFGKVYTTNFKQFTTADKGAAALLSTLDYYGATAEASTGNAYATASRMFTSPTLGPGRGYFSGHTHKGTAPNTPQDYYERTLDYAKAIKGSADRIADALGEPHAVSLGDPGGPGGALVQIAGTAVGVAGLSLLGWLAWSRWKGIGL